jgi:hypothetical protein
MERINLRTAIGLGIVLIMGVTALVAWRAHAWEPTSVDVVCDQVDNPGMGGNDFTMRFTVSVKGGTAATALVFDIADTDLRGQPVGEVSTYTLTGTFSPGPPRKILESDVPAPPHYHSAKFSKLDCTLKHATFEDGTHW